MSDHSSPADRLASVSAAVRDVGEPLGVLGLNIVLIWLVIDGGCRLSPGPQTVHGKIALYVFVLLALLTAWCLRVVTRAVLGGTKTVR